MSDYGNVEKSILVDAVSQSYFVIKCDDDAVQLCPSGGGDDLFFTQEQLLAMIELIDNDDGEASEAQKSGKKPDVVDAGEILEERLRAEADKSCSFEWKVIKMDGGGVFFAYEGDVRLYGWDWEPVGEFDRCEELHYGAGSDVDIDWKTWEIRK